MAQWAEDLSGISGLIYMQRFEMGRGFLRPEKSKLLDQRMATC
jgi:hypothetical protein